MLENPSLYVHLPWCVKKCPYCDFNSHTAPAAPPFDDYVDALVADLSDQSQRFSPEPLESIFFGGGTPSLFSPEQVGRVIEAAKELIGFSQNIEVTLEANPGTTEYSNFADYKDAGINRVSLGVQSLNDRHLSLLGRIHGADEARRACHEVRKSGISELNIDLMYGLPEQTLEMALQDIDQAIAIGPSHISHYNLTIEPNTLFAVHRPANLPSSDLCFDMQLRAQMRLADAGFEHYEVSAYAHRQARSGEFSDSDVKCSTNSQARHNLNYWQFGDYLGIGAGAHGKITTPNKILRTSKAKHPTLYLGNPIQTVTTDVPAQQQMFEFMLNRTRLNKVISLAELESTTHLNRSQALPKLAEAATRKLLTKVDDEHWQVSELGRRFLNDLQQIFLP